MRGRQKLTQKEVFMFREKKVFRSKGILLMCIVMMMLGIVLPFSIQSYAAESDETVKIDIRGADDKSEAALDEIEDNKGIIVFADEQSGMQSLGTANTDKVVLSYSRLIHYENYVTRNFRVKFDGKTRVAYCIQPKEPPLAEGTWTAKEYNKSIMTKALYYSYGYPGYDKRMRPYLSKKDLDDDYEDDDGAYALSHMVLSYFYDNKSASTDAFLGVSSETRQLVKTVAGLIENSWPAVPDNSSLSLNITKARALWDKKAQKQKTPTFKLIGHDDNRIIVTVPTGATIVRNSGGVEKSFTAGTKVKIFGGDSFYFTAPETVKGIYKSPQMSGVLTDFQPYLIAVSGKQDIVFCGVGEKDSVAFSIDWVNLGKINLRKVSELPEITQGNKTYSLNNAKYMIYDSSGKLYETLITNEKGEASAKVPYGSYFIREAQAPEGYTVEVSKHDVNVKSENVSVTIKEKPMIGIPEIAVYKKDRELSGTGKEGESVSQFAATLENAQYTIRYYDGYYDEKADYSNIKPVRTWVIRTDASGKAYLNDKYLVSGDELYHNKDGTAVLPLGTVTLQETKAPEGYVLDDRIHVRQIKGDGKTQIVNAFELLTHEEQIIRGDLKFFKQAEGDDGFLSGIPFKITSKSTGESVVVVTDENGMVTTEKNRIWMGIKKVSDTSKGALPFDTYVIDEVRCDKNVGLQLIKGVEAVVDRNDSVLDLGIMVDKRIVIHTTARDKKTQNKNIMKERNAQIRDTVDYKGLEAGKEYVLKGKLVYRDSGEAVRQGRKEITGTSTFTAESQKGSACVDFNFDSRNLKSEKVVVFEYLYEAGELIASHEDLDSEEQTVTVGSGLPSLPATGDELPLMIVLGIAAASLFGAIRAFKKSI